MAFFIFYFLFFIFEDLKQDMGWRTGLLFYQNWLYNKIILIIIFKNFEDVKIRAPSQPRYVFRGSLFFHATVSMLKILSEICIYENAQSWLLLRP